LQSIVDLIPLNGWTGKIRTKALAVREVYFQFLSMRLNHSQIFIKEAQNARETLI
jgi:hypothetical protein